MGGIREERLIPGVEGVGIVSRHGDERWQLRNIIVAKVHGMMVLRLIRPDAGVQARGDLSRNGICTDSGTTRCIRSIFRCPVWMALSGFLGNGGTCR